MPGVVIGGPFLEYTNGSCQSQILSATMGNEITAEQQEANKQWAIKSHNSWPQVAAELAAARERIAELEAAGEYLAGADRRITELEAEMPARDARMKREGAAVELERLHDHIQEYIGPDGARDEIRRICASRAKDLREEAARLKGESNG